MFGPPDAYSDADEMSSSGSDPFEKPAPKPKDQPWDGPDLTEIPDIPDKPKPPSGDDIEEMLSTPPYRLGIDS